VRLKDIRTEKQVTQVELGKIVGLPASRISVIENGKAYFRLPEAVKVADYLGVSLDELAGIAYKSLTKRGKRIQGTKIMSKCNVTIIWDTEHEPFISFGRVFDRLMNAVIQAIEAAETRRDIK